VAFSFFIIMGDGLPSGQPFPFPEKVIKTGLLLGRISHLTQQDPREGDVNISVPESLFVE
jgi:hypothetical protein